ncbi:Zinc finger homeobox protein 3 [Trichinella pseudospiralis]|uniref:Zinc finger homeobox protein 3 n=1 Tax=Trichinella pseudospiralis TaxID=6337 RepID=A0A0V1HLY8_TRIPS|nr:Zinc finger homeobox protein 3 [Trichinella pseudospiralis]
MLPLQAPVEKRPVVCTTGGYDSLPAMEANAAGWMLATCDEPSSVFCHIAYSTDGCTAYLVEHESNAIDSDIKCRFDELLGSGETLVNEQRGDLTFLHHLSTDGQRGLYKLTPYESTAGDLSSSSSGHLLCLVCKLRFVAVDRFLDHCRKAHTFVGGFYTTQPVNNAENRGPPIRAILLSTLEESPKQQQQQQHSTPAITETTSAEETSDELSGKTTISAAGPGFSGLAMPSAPLTPQSRNSSKTLKCPKCNWHYKYQETLEIHMKEKHAQGDVSCVYCLSNHPHPRLARGENYICGYKPYRCDICHYSTTTKGNLAIHMQSDKHLNNMQELQHAGFVGDAASATATSQQHLAMTKALTNDQQHSSGQLVPVNNSSATKSLTFRCEPCNYETYIARNLKIHMTSEKHAQNAGSVRRDQSNGMIKTDDSIASCMPTMLGGPLEMNLLYGGFDQRCSTESGQSDVQTWFEISETMHHFQCCICLDFTCDTVEEMAKHAFSDRGHPNESDVSFVSGNYLCNLCRYKTHLKANFTLHMKTDKHLQRLQLVNHIQEGTILKEWRLQFLNHNNPVQLRCVACNDFCDNLHKLQSHVATFRHKCCSRALQKVRLADVALDSTLKDSQTGASNCDDQLSPNRILYCVLCRFIAPDKKRMLAHLLSLNHTEAVNEVLVSMEMNAGFSGTDPAGQDEFLLPDWIEERQWNGNNSSLLMSSILEYGKKV